MPLKITVKKNEKLIVNGAVLENAGNATSLVIHNQAMILRQKDIMTEADAATPAARVYFSLQCLYIFPEQSDRYLGTFRAYLAEYAAAAPSAADLAAEIGACVDKGETYRALALTKKLLAHENKVLGSTHRFLRSETGDGEIERNSAPALPADGDANHEAGSARIVA